MTIDPDIIARNVAARPDQVAQRQARAAAKRKQREQVAILKALRAQEREAKLVAERKALFAPDPTVVVVGKPLPPPTPPTSKRPEPVQARLAEELAVLGRVGIHRNGPIVCLTRDGRHWRALARYDELVAAVTGATPQQAQSAYLGRSTPCPPPKGVVCPPDLFRTPT